MRVDAISPGTTKNPPPIPKNPDRTPVIPPDASSLGDAGSGSDDREGDGA